MHIIFSVYIKRETVIKKRIKGIQFFIDEAELGLPPPAPPPPVPFRLRVKAPTFSSPNFLNPSKSVISVEFIPVNSVMNTISIISLVTSQLTQHINP